MRRNVVATIALTSLLLLAALMAGCGDFFVSEGSVSSVTVSPTGVLMETSGTYSFKANSVAVNGNKTDITTTATWTTSDSQLATVDSGGNVAADPQHEGTATLTAKAPNSKLTGTATLFVTSSLPQSLTVQTPNSTIALGSTAQFHALAALGGSSNSTDVSSAVTWQSSNSSIASVGLTTGVVKGVSTCGTVTTCPTITATAITTSTSTITGSYQIAAIQ